MSQTWQVRSLDVWGHSAEECECNCECAFEGGKHDDNCERHDMCEGFQVNHLKETARGKVEIDDFSDGTFLSVDDAETGEPLYHLQLDDQY